MCCGKNLAKPRYMKKSSQRISSYFLHFNCYSIVRYCQPVLFIKRHDKPMRTLRTSSTQTTAIGAAVMIGALLHDDDNRITVNDDAMMVVVDAGGNTRATAIFNGDGTARFETFRTESN